MCRQQEMEPSIHHKHIYESTSHEGTLCGLGFQHPGQPGQVPAEDVICICWSPAVLCVPVK